MCFLIKRGCNAVGVDELLIIKYKDIRSQEELKTRMKVRLLPTFNQKQNKVVVSMFNVALCFNLRSWYSIQSKSSVRIFLAHDIVFDLFSFQNLYNDVFLSLSKSSNLLIFLMKALSAITLSTFIQKFLCLWFCSLLIGIVICLVF